MNSRRINDTADSTRQPDDKRRCHSNYNRLFTNDNDDTDIDNDTDMDDDKDANTGVFKLNKVLNRFGNNIELLELILTSKVEEDRRLTEEAKLKIKQLEYQKDKKREGKSTDHSFLPSTQLPRLYNHPLSNGTVSSSSDNDSTSVNRPSFLSANHLHRQNHYYTPDPKNNHQSDLDEHQQHKTAQHYLPKHRQLPSIGVPPASNDDVKRSPHFLAAPSLSASSPPPPFSSPSPSTPVPLTLKYSNNNRQSSPTFYYFSSTNPPRDFSRQPDATTTPLSPMLPQQPRVHTSTIINNKLPIPQIPQNHHHQESDSHDRSSSSPSSRKQPFKRRRREMQSITMIIETKEFPYNDNYSWKNNGNTVHKKSGQRSIYYKCSNAAKGCHVNKTVTCKGQDEYLIKYRGRHLKTCLISNNDSTSTPSFSSTQSSLASHHPLDYNDT